MSEWISVKDRLPNKDGEYLCSHCYSGSAYISVSSFAQNLEKVDEFNFMGEKRAGWFDYDSEWGHFERDTVTHWMPLPELPER